MRYCPNINSRDFFKWNHGFNPCFIETVSSTSIFLFMIIFGYLQKRNYKKYSVELEYWQRQTSFCFNLQIFLILIISSLSIGRVILQNTFDNNGNYVNILQEQNKFYFYTLVVGLLYFFAWMMCLYLVILERNRSLPGVPPRGHGLTLITFWALCLIWENLSFLNWWHENWFWTAKNLSDKIEIGLFSLRYIGTTLLFLIGIRAPALLSIPIYHHVFEINQTGPINDSWFVNIWKKTYNTNGMSRNNIPITSSQSTWNNFLIKCKLFTPFLWPKRQYVLQFKMFLCLLIIIAGRIINVVLPLTYKSLVNSLTNKVFCWKTILLFAFLQYLQGFGVGGTGLLTNLRSYLWISIQQYSTRKLKVDIYTHILSLSVDWHINKKTGEVLRIIDRGSSSINNILNYVSFQIGPTVIDILVAIIYLMIYFGIWYSFIITFAMTLYIVSTIIITEWRTKHRRKMNQLDNLVSSRSAETLYNFETVKYNAAEWYEIRQYDKVLKDYQSEEWITSSSLNGLNILQGTICVWIGLVGGAILCAKQIVDPSAIIGSHRILTVGDFVLFMSYLAQLYIPLNWFGTFYRSIQQSLIDLENMIDLMSQEPFDNPKSITYIPVPTTAAPSKFIDFEEGDFPDYPPIVIKNGVVEFRHVYFAYKNDQTPAINSVNESAFQDNVNSIEPSKEGYILKDINFNVGTPPSQGNVVAKTPRILGIVGPSGAGKTTIMRLLFKLYNPSHGSIFIDGQDISKVDTISLRRQLGLVAQDTNLFNQSVGYNIDYGTFRLPLSFLQKITTKDDDPSSMNEEDVNTESNSDSIIQDAAKAAQIHNAITEFPKGYDTIVGEKGLRLSGGEKQRVSIARLIVKSPKIILLDEATSSLDTANESAIQENLNSLFTLERQATMIIIAHRLSTVVNADEILVLNKGSIAERGSHVELLLKDGIYADMWNNQLRQKFSEKTENLLPATH